jgi:hypothetical protein
MRPFHKGGSMLSRTTHTSGQRKATTDIHCLIPDRFVQLQIAIGTLNGYSFGPDSCFKLGILYIIFQILLFFRNTKDTYVHLEGGTREKNVRAPVLKAEPYITGGFKGMRVLLLLFDLSLLSSSTVSLASFLLFLISKLPNTKIGNF